MNFITFAVCVECIVEFRRDLMYSNIMPTINGTLTIRISYTCDRLSTIWNGKNMLFKMIVRCVNFSCWTTSLILRLPFADINLHQYFEDCIRAARLYILNESEASIPAARRHMKMLVLFVFVFEFVLIAFCFDFRMYWVDKISKFAIVALFTYFIGGFLFRAVFSSSGHVRPSISPILDSIDRI